MHKKLLITALSVGILCNAQEQAEEVAIDTGINIFQVLRELPLDQKLIILSAGKLRALVDESNIAILLQKLEVTMDLAYRQALIKARAQNKSVDELTFKQNIVLALYAMLYKMVEQEIAKNGTEEQAIIFAQQLTPEEIAEIFAEE